METWSSSDASQRGDIAERRLWPREDLSAELLVEFLNDRAEIDEERQVASCRLRDLSESGLRFRVEQRIEPGRLLDLWLTLPGQQIAVHLQGEVVWCDTHASGACQVGLSFYNPSHEAMARLAQAMEPLLH